MMNYAFAKARYQYLLLLITVLVTSTIVAQTKVGGVIYDEFGDTVPFANVVFPNSGEGTISNDNGRFYLQSDTTYDSIVISFLGYETTTIELNQKVNLELNITLKSETAALDAVVVYSGKTSKKDNPALDILRKVWENRRKNGLSQFDQYQYDKYEKLEFDMNTIDSAMVNSKLFRGMEFIFDYADTSSVTGKTYLPIFINESLATVYGDNELNKEKTNIKANKNSGFSNNQTIIAFVKDLYADIDVYERYLKFFEKSFTSPVGKSGIDTYNYILKDTAIVGGVEAYNIVYYPRRKGELTFKGDFWVAADSYAIKEINMQATKSANVNWVKEIYIEQEFDVLNDSLFLITRDYFMSDFALSKKESSKGIYGKRTTLFDNYEFDIPKDPEFYKRRVNDYDPEIYDRDEAYWDKNRLEKLNKDEKQIYTMLDTLKTNTKFKRLYNLGTILASGYYEFDGFDVGPIFSIFGFNDVEGLRLRGGGRTFFSSNDMWRLEGYGAYGFRDDQFKYGIAGKWLLDRKSRLTISGGNRRDIEQLGASLTNTNDVLGRSLASSALVTAGNVTREAGKTFGAVPLALLNVVPGNQTFFNIRGTFNTMNFYEFVSDQYVTMHLNHNFNGRLFSRVPLLRELNLRELVGIRAVYGTISDENIALNASGLTYQAPEDVYWEYSAGIGNIFKVFRLDVSFRGGYNFLPDARRMAITGSFGFTF